MIVEVKEKFPPEGENADSRLQGGMLQSSPMKKIIQKFINDLCESGGWKSFLLYSSWSISITTAMSYGLGLLRDVLFGRIIGLSRALDIYTLAINLPEAVTNIFVISFLAAAFVPIFSKKYDEDKQKGYIYANQIISWLLLIAIFFGIVLLISMPYIAHWFLDLKKADSFTPQEVHEFVRLTRLFLLSPIIFAISRTLGNMLVSVRELFWYGLAPVLYNLSIIAGGVLLYPRFGLVGLAMGPLIGALLQLLNNLRVLRLKKYDFKFNLNLKLSPEIKETFWLALPKVGQFAMVSLMIIGFSRIASGLGEGATVTYSYARNFQSAPVSILGIAIATAMYRNLSHDYGQGDFQKLRQDLRKGRTRLLTYSILGAIGLVAFIWPAVHILFNFDPEEVMFLSKIVMIYAIAIPLESLLHFYHRAYFSLHHSLIPAISHGANIGVMLLVAWWLSASIGLYAIPVGFSVGLSIHLLIIMNIFPWFLKKKEKMFAKGHQLL